MAKDRDATSKERIYYIYEGVRRNDEYRSLYQRWHNFGKLKRKLSHSKINQKYDIEDEIYRKFSICPPINPHLNYKQVFFLTIAMAFGKKTLEMTYPDLAKAIKSRDAMTPITVYVNMKAKNSPIVKEFAEELRFIRKKRRASGADDSFKKMKLAGRSAVKPFDYIKHYEIYDRFKKYDIKNHPIPFATIARQDLLSEQKRALKKKRTGDDYVDERMYYDTVDIRAKHYSIAYEQAKWTIEGGFRILMFNIIVR